MNTCTYNKWCSPHSDGISCSCECHAKSQEDTMTELIPGKRYRWIVEGTVYGTQADIELPYGFTCSEPELLPDPLPTTPGSVIQHEGRLYIRAIPTTSQTYVWTPLDNLGHRFDESYDLQGATVLFDAGADRA